MSTSSAEGIPLDLNDLFSSPDDPRIEGDPERLSRSC